MSKNESVHLKLTGDLLKEIDEFKNEYYFKSRSDALRYLISLGLKHHIITENLLSNRTKDVQKLLEKK